MPEQQTTLPATKVTGPGVLERFLGKVDTSAGLDGCHPWTGARSKGGYGQIKIDRRLVYAHRWALARHIGRPLTDAELALHRCDNPPCVNPRHLYVGSQADNMQDCRKRGRLRNPIADARRAQTRCDRGHELTAANTYIKTNGHRRCQTCRRAEWVR